MVGRNLGLTAVGLPVLALLALSIILLLTAPMASASSTINPSFCNGTGQTVNDLHVVFNTTVTVDNAGAFSAVSGDGTNMIALSGGTVADASCTSITVTGQGSGTNIVRWWWTVDGRPVTPKVALVQQGQPGTDLAITPLVFPNNGDVASVDIMIQLPSSSDELFAFESHFNITPDGVVKVIDADLVRPAIQLQESGDGLALSPLIPLRQPILGFPDDGDDTRSCLSDQAGQTGDDSMYDFIKGATGDDVNVELQLLNQHWMTEWGGGWCGPTSVGISMGWFAETASGDTANHANLIPDTNGNNVIDSADKYAAIATLGMLMHTNSGSGTTDNNFVEGIRDYVALRGLTGDFIIKVFDHPDPTFWDYKTELMDDEDVLVGITYPGGEGHWLVGRSYSTTLNDNGTPSDPSDDYYKVSFVDPGTSSVYHTKMRAWDGAIWYRGQWVEFDIMVSVSPTPPGREPNADTAQYFSAQNQQGSTGDFTFVLLGDPDPGNVADHRTPQLRGDSLGRMFVARFNLRAVGPGSATINWVNPVSGAASVNLVYIDGAGDPVLYPMPSLGTPAAILQVAPKIVARVRLQGPERPDPQGWMMPLEVKLFSPGAGDNVLNDTPVATYMCGSMVREAPWGVCRINATHAGLFDVTVSSARTLVSVKRAVTLPGTVDFPDPLREGDVTQSPGREMGVINLQDFTAWLPTWRDTCSVSVPTDISHYSIGDFDKNCNVNVLDFTVFLANWQERSPQENP